MGGRKVPKGKKKPKYFGGTFKHFADDVIYNFEEFLSKNMEKVSGDTKVMFAKASNELVCQVAGGKARKSRGFKSVTSIFSKALDRLMKNLEATDPYFIRCVNPNNQKRHDIFVRQVVKISCDVVVLLKHYKF